MAEDNNKAQVVVTMKQIKFYFHCRKCLEELPVGWSPQEYALIEIGITETGIQVWCRRHDIEITHLESKEVAEKFVICRCAACKKLNRGGEK